MTYLDSIKAAYEALPAQWPQYSTPVSADHICLAEFPGESGVTRGAVAVGEKHYELVTYALAWNVEYPESTPPAADVARFIYNAMERAVCLGPTDTYLRYLSKPPKARVVYATGNLMPEMPEPEWEPKYRLFMARPIQLEVWRDFDTTDHNMLFSVRFACVPLEVKQEYK